MFRGTIWSSVKILITIIQISRVVGLAKGLAALEFLRTNPYRYVHKALFCYCFLNTVALAILRSCLEIQSMQTWTV